MRSIDIVVILQPFGSNLKDGLFDLPLNTVWEVRGLIHLPLKENVFVFNIYIQLIGFFWLYAAFWGFCNLSLFCVEFD